MEEFLEIMGVFAIYSAFGSLVSIAMYVLMSLGLYTLAQRRGIQHAWLAWVPVGSMWILGSLADDYQLKAKGQTKNRRKVLMILTAVMVVLAIVVCGSVFGSLFELIDDAQRLERRSASYTTYEYNEAVDEMMEDFVLSFVPMFLLSLIMSVVAIVAAVFQYICLYDLYASCDPSNKTLYLLLSIFVGGLSSIFVFICRNKDQGMYPPAPYGWQYQPQYQQPQYQPPQYQQPTYQPPENQQ